MSLGKAITLSRSKQTTWETIKSTSTSLIHHFLKKTHPAILNVGTNIQPSTDPAQAIEAEPRLETLSPEDNTPITNAISSNPSESDGSYVIDLPDTIEVPIPYYWGLYWSNENYFIPTYGSQTYLADMTSLIQQLDYAQTAMSTRIDRLDACQTYANATIVAIVAIGGIVIPAVVDQSSDEQNILGLVTKISSIGTAFFSELSRGRRNSAIAIKQTAITSEGILREENARYSM